MYCSKSKAQCCGKGEADLNNEKALLLSTAAKSITRLPVAQEKQYNVTAQVLRSSCEWSIGCDINGDDWYENSIHQAYITEILNAEHLIYIENQFFISSTANSATDSDGDGKVSCSERFEMFRKKYLSTEEVQNEIAHAIATRIERAIQNDETLRVVIMLPNYPEVS